MPDLPFDLRQSEREREREEELEEDRAARERRMGTAVKRRWISIISKVNYTALDSFLEYFQFLSLSLFNEQRTRVESFVFFCRDTLLYLIAREEEGDTKTSPVWRRVPRKRYPCILRALYLINRTNEFPFPSLRSTKRPSFSTTFGFENIGRCRVL